MAVTNEIENAQPKVSIVVRSYNEEEHIGKLLHGIAQQDYSNIEVILVDSGSTDRTVEIAMAHTQPVRLVRIAKSEFTFGRALNRGCAAATGEFLVFVSAHVYPEHRDWLSCLLAPFSEEQVVLSYGRQRGEERNKFSEHRIFEKWFPDEAPELQRSYFCNNANCAIRRRDWLRRKYDEVLPGLEDLAWAKRAQQEGGAIAYRADAGIIHVHDETWSGVRNRYRREAMAMRRIEEGFGLSLWRTVTLMINHVLADAAYAARRKLLRRELKSILLFRFNQLYGGYLGYRGDCEVTGELRDRLYYPARPKAPVETGGYAASADRIDYSSAGY